MGHFDWIGKTSYFYNNNEELCSFLFIVVQCSTGQSVSKDSKSRDRRMDSQRRVHYFSQRRCPPELQGWLGGGRHGCHPRQVSRLLHLHLASSKQYSCHQSRIPCLLPSVCEGCRSIDQDKMRFANIIHRTINDVTFEAAEWIVDGYDRGVYFNSAQGGKLIWDMATTEPGLQNKNY